MSGVSMLLGVSLAGATTLPPPRPDLRGVNDYQAAGTVLSFPQPDSNKLNFTCEFTVPPKPPSWDGQTQVYLWCGINWYDSAGCLGVMQPVLTYGCSPDAFSGVGCGTNSSDPNYSKDPYWYFSSQYVLGWAPGQGHGSKQMVKTVPGSKIYSEMSYDTTRDSWFIYGRDESTRESSTFNVDHPLLDSSRTWRAVQADAKTSATLFAVSEPHQVTNPGAQMPNAHDFQIVVTGALSGLAWQAQQGSAKIEQKGGPSCSDSASVNPGECQSFAAGGQCTTDPTWCKLCAKSCGEHGATCGCVPHNPPIVHPTVVGMDLTWQESNIVV